MQQQCANQRWDAIVSSPLRRCSAFAQNLSTQLAIPLSILPCWQEIDFGQWEGKTAQQIEEETPGILDLFYSDPTKYSPPDGEPFACFNDRINQSWHTLLHQYPEQHILLITHGGVIRTLFMQLLAIPVPHNFRVHIGHASLSRFTCWQNETDHFPQLLLHRPPPDMK
jgi:alpha-ribazole phosphatase